MHPPHRSKCGQGASIRSGEARTRESLTASANRPPRFTAVTRARRRSPGTARSQKMTKPESGSLHTPRPPKARPVHSTSTTSPADGGAGRGARGAAAAVVVVRTRECRTGGEARDERVGHHRNSRRGAGGRDARPADARIAALITQRGAARMRQCASLRGHDGGERRNPMMKQQPSEASARSALNTTRRLRSFRLGLCRLSFRLGLCRHRLPRVAVGGPAGER